MCEEIASVVNLKMQVSRIGYVESNAVVTYEMLLEQLINQPIEVRFDGALSLYPFSGAPVIAYYTRHIYQRVGRNSRAYCAEWLFDISPLS